jgi:hypothetical protein
MVELPKKKPELIKEEEGSLPEMPSDVKPEEMF